MRHRDQDFLAVRAVPARIFYLVMQVQVSRLPTRNEFLRIVSPDDLVDPESIFQTNRRRLRVKRRVLDPGYDVQKYL